MPHLLAPQPPGSTRTLAHERDGGVVTRTVLPGGLRVITESMPGIRSASFGIWLGVGSRDESRALAGVSHYLEHLLFKGTHRRDALAISAALDAVGGELNAFTTKEHTCYYAHVLAADLPLAVDVVADLVTDPLLDPAEVEVERSVILDEIAMRDDDPADLAHDMVLESLFGDTPLGRPVIGTTESIAALRRAQIFGYYGRHYRLPAMVVAAAGGVDHRTVLRLVRKAFGARLAGDAAPYGHRSAAGRRTAAPARRTAVVRRPTEQANLVLARAAYPRADERRIPLGVLSAALGGGPSSRLFQEVREKRGLAYSVYSFASHYAGGGLFGVYAGCAPRNVGEVLTVVLAELDRVATGGLGEDEVVRGKGQLRGGLVLGLEDADSRMSRLGKAELGYGEVLDVDELVGRIDAVTAADVSAVAADVLTNPACLVAVGSIGRRNLDRYVD